MGIFDDIVGTTTPQAGTSGGLFDDIIGSNPNVEPNSAFGIFQSQGVRDYMRELQKQSVSQEELNKDHSFAGITSAPKEIWKGIKTGLENTPWNAPVKTERDFNKPLGTVLGPAWENTKDKWRTLDDRLNARLQPLTDKWLDPTQEKPSFGEIINGLSGAGAEIVDSTFAPITGALEGASKTPGLSFASNVIRKFFGAVGGGGGEIASEITDLVPFISPETRAQLEEPIQFWGGFVGQLAGGYGVGKAVGKATPTILETKMKLANTVDIIMRDKLVQNKIAELNAKMRGYEGDYREGEAIDWGNTKSPGAEDVIDWGDNNIPAELSKKTNQFVPDNELPIIDAETGTLRPKLVEEPVGKTPGVIEEQAPKKVPYSAVKAERENYTGKDVQVTTDGVDGPAVVVSTPSKTEVVVRLADGTEITVPTNAVRDVRTNAEVIAAAESRATQPTQTVQTQVPGEQGTQTADTAISVKPAQPVSTAKTAKEMKGGEPTKNAEPQATRNDLVTVNGKTYQLSGDTLVKYQQAKQAYDASIARLNAEYARATAGRRQTIAKELKALGMQWSATLRETTGNFTATELAKQVKTESTNYKGKQVIVEVNGKKVEGEVIGTAYGKIKVRLKDGAEVTVTKDKVTDPRTKEDINAGVLKREGVTEYDPSQPVGIQRGNGEVIKITDKQTGKSEELIVISKKPDGSLVTTRKDVYFPRKTTPEKFDIEYLDRTEPLPSGGVTFGELEAMDRANEAAAKKQTPKEEVPKEEEQLGSDEYNQILIELDLAEAGKRGAYVYQDKYGSIEKITSKQSTFPEWMPEGTRLRSVIDRYMKDRKGTVNDEKIKYKGGSVLDRLDKAVREEEQKRIETNRLQREAESVQPREDTSIAQEEYAKAFPDMVGADTTQGGVGPMKPISGSGELRTPTATQRILSENLQAEFGELPQYSRVNWDEQARLVQDFISRDPTASRNVAMGREHAPAGILDTAVWKEYRLRARANGDVAASIQLAKSTIPEALSRFGQETGVLSTLDKSDLTGIIIDASKQYVKNWEKRNPGKSGEAEITKAVEQVRNSMKKNASSREVYKEIARRLLCK